MKKIFFIFILLFIFIFDLNADIKYGKYIDKQIELVSKLEDKNITSDKIASILKKQEKNYLNRIEFIISNKNSFIKQYNLYDSDIFRLKKILSINKRASNRYAVLRDEVKINSLKLLQNQNKMMIDVLKALESKSSDEFKTRLNEIVLQNQLANKDILDLDYSTDLKINSNSKILKQVKKNIVEFYRLLEINVDTINQLYSYESRIYRFNEYANYNLLGVVLFLNSHKVVQSINSILENYGLSVFKLVLILSIFLIIYFIRKFVYVVLENYLIRLERLQIYSEIILKKVHKPFEIIIILINIELTVYIYNDFIKDESVVKFFNIFYVVLSIWLLHRVLNAIVAIKIENLSKIKIRNGIVNVGIKIVNFIIVIIGLLMVLNIIGVNLTAVLSGLGIGGIAVALASKDSLSNFFGTISVLLSNVFSQGDWIEVDGKEGVVVEIGLRVTTIRTFDNALIAIPNAILANKEVKNWNKRRLGRRIKMKLGVKYDSSHKDIKKAIYEIRTMLDTHKGIATKNTTYQYNNKKMAKLVSKDDAEGVKKTLLVYLDEFSDSSINILIYCFSKSVKWEEWLAVKEDIMYKIMEIFEKNNLEFAFPSISIYEEK